MFVIENAVRRLNLTLLKKFLFVVLLFALALLMENIFLIQYFDNNYVIRRRLTDQNSKLAILSDRKFLVPYFFQSLELNVSVFKIFAKVFLTNKRILWKKYGITSSLDFIEFESNVKPICILPKLDPWDKKITEFLDSKFNIMADCKAIVHIIKTTLWDKILNIEKLEENDEIYVCMFRCLFYKTDSLYSASNWTQFEEPTEVTCEIVETKCTLDDEEIYINMHTQIISDSIPQNRIAKSKKFRPNVIMMIFDSTSSSSGQRSLAQTMQVLRYKYDAITFRGHNKVGINSRPNAWALFTGIRVEDLPVGTMQERLVKSELPDSCRSFVENYAYVGFNFTNAGYVSTFIEDWAQGAFNWPNCHGFNTNPVTHNMRPYWIRLKCEQKIEKVLYDNCKSTFNVSLEYMQQFLDAYKFENAPKFSIFWITDLAHDHLNGLYSADSVLLKFFMDNEDELQESFLFFMGDHGLRFTDIRKTQIGEIEDNNPMLVITTPKSLRSDEVLKRNLQRNSQYLTSHYDLYATLMDIAEIAPRKNFTDFSVYDWSSTMVKNKGSSLLRPLDPSSRDCKSLDIPETYCICQQNKSIIANASSNQYLISAAKQLTASLNSIITQKTAFDLCFHLIFQSVISAEKIIAEDGERVFYSITYNVFPSEGIFQGIVRINKNGSFTVITKIQNRINSYGSESECVSDEILRPICICVDFIKNSVAHET